MKVLITPMAWSTHYHQLVGLVWAFQAGGHLVRVAAQPPVLDTVTSTGAMAVSVGGGYNVVEGMSDLVNDRNEQARQLNIAGPDGFAPEVLRGLLDRRMAPHTNAALDVAEDLVAFARTWQPDLVMSDPLIYAAPIAAGVVGAPLVRHLWGTDFLRFYAMPGTGVSEKEDARAAWPRALVELYERYGVEPQADVAVATVDTCPETLQIPGTPNRIAVRYTSYHGATVLPPWVLDTPDRPRVLVLWGSSSTRFLGDKGFLVPRILEALQEMDVDIVVAVKAADRDRLKEVPAGVRVVVDLPIDLMLPTCSAIIHQSGAGTMLASAFCGVPQVTLPQVADHFLVSEQLRRTGAGISLMGDRTSVDGIREAVSSVLFTDGPAAAARRLREEMAAQPAPAEIIPTLERLV